MTEILLAQRERGCVTKAGGREGPRSQGSRPQALPASATTVDCSKPKTNKRTQTK